MWAQLQNLLSWRKQEYQRVAESELAHVSRAGASCALVSHICQAVRHAQLTQGLEDGRPMLAVAALTYTLLLVSAAVSAGHDMLCMHLSSGECTQVRQPVQQ
jgi:hypothetical protein